MIKNKSLLLFILLIFTTNRTLLAQGATLSLKELISIISLYHPIMKQSDARVQQAFNGIQIGRGGFDPEIQAGYGEKELASTPYYNRFQTEITLPTWYGISLRSGTESLQGNRVDASETIGTLQYLGMEIPLAKNLLYDKRRFALQQAKLLYKMSIQDQQNVINDLLMNAIEKYWQWVKYDQLKNVFTQNIQNSQKRFDWIKASYLFGERAAVDTLEAYTQLQAMEILLLQFKQQLTISRIELSGFLWDGDGQSFDIPDSVSPITGWELEASELFELKDLNQWLERIPQHPALLMTQQKLNMLGNEKRLKFQELLPKLSFQYNLLHKSNTTFIGMPFQNNYQYGIKFQMPLRLSEGRGSYKQIKQKLIEGQWEFNRKERDIEVKIRNYYTEYSLYKEQVKLMENNYLNYLNLVKAEEQKLELGESSLFMINSRESKLIEVMEKWIDMKTKLQKTLCSLGWSAGILRSF